MDAYKDVTLKDLELLDWDPNIFDDEVDSFLTPEEAHMKNLIQFDLISTSKMEYNGQKSTYTFFCTRASPGSTQERFSQSTMECSTQESVSSMNMDISSQASSDCDKMCISSQETSLGTQDTSSELKEQDGQITFLATNDSYSPTPNIYKHCDYSEANNSSFQRSPSLIDNFNQDPKSMLVSELNSAKKSKIVQISENSNSRKTDLAESNLCNEKKYLRTANSENASKLPIQNLDDGNREVCRLSDDFKEQSSISTCNPETFINCEDMILSSQGSSDSQVMDISSQETTDRLEAATLKKNNLNENKISLKNKGNIEQPFLAKKLCCNSRYQIKKSISSIRRRHMAMMQREKALKNREARIAEREAAILRREQELKAREQKILNYESAIFQSGK